SNDNQTEIIIRPKGDKDSKVTIEIRNGEFFVNGKPLEKFDDQNIEIEKRIVRDGPFFGMTTSPFRGNAWDQERFQQDLNRRMGDVNRRMHDIQMYRSNEAFLGVSSRKAETGGATVLEITKGSPAEKAGLKKGDVITKVNDQEIDSPDNLFETVHQFKPGEKVKIFFKRDGKEQSVSAILDKSKDIQKTYRYNYEYRMPEINEYRTPELPNMPGMESPLWGPMPPKIGIKAQDSEEGKGVNVLEVTEGSAAEKAGLKKGDLILKFDGTDVNNANDLIQKVRDSRDKSLVKVVIQRDGKVQTLDIRIPRKLRTAEL
ncbi:MAG: PDZ domain-containing protein, partial [Bacteroidota bacterium]|nr:PDZ domain-containing protein [Bacteroidota bacterium]